MTHTKTQTHLPKSDPPLRETRVAGARLTFTDEGASQGTAFFAIHGVPGSVRDFRYLAPPLTSFARLIRVDLPGSGGSEPRRDALRSLEVRAGDGSRPGRPSRRLRAFRGDRAFHGRGEPRW